MAMLSAAFIEEELEEAKIIEQMRNDDFVNYDCVERDNWEEYQNRKRIQLEMEDYMAFDHNGDFDDWYYENDDYDEDYDDQLIADYMFDD